MLDTDLTGIDHVDFDPAKMDEDQLDELFVGGKNKSFIAWIGDPRLSATLKVHVTCKLFAADTRI